MSTDNLLGCTIRQQSKYADDVLGEVVQVLPHNVLEVRREDGSTVAVDGKVEVVSRPQPEPMPQPVAVDAPLSDAELREIAAMLENADYARVVPEWAVKTVRELMERRGIA